MRKFLVSLILLAAFPLQAEELAGQVVDFAGTAWITSEGQAARSPALRQPVYLKDEIKTAEDGAVKILFRDDTLLVIKENSRILITEFLFDAKAKRRKVGLDALFGRIRVTVTRFFGENWPVEVKTPTAVAGIRGTDFGSVINARKTTLYCFESERVPIQAYSRQFPSAVVFLKRNEAIDIVATRQALDKDKFAIPREILEQKDFLFEISGGQAEAKARQSTVEQAKTILRQAGKAQETQAQVEKIIPSIVQGEQEALSTGDETTTGTKVKITLPK